MPQIIFTQANAPQAIFAFKKYLLTHFKINVVEQVGLLEKIVHCTVQGVPMPHITVNYNRSIDNGIYISVDLGGTHAKFCVASLLSPGSLGDK